jgi:hypothetical protein
MYKFILLQHAVVFGIMALMITIIQKEHTE